jgi:TonB family protein
MRMHAAFVAFAIASVHPRFVHAQAVPPSPVDATTVEPPSLISDPAVPYPAGAEGDAEVTLVIVVAPDGRVRSVSAEGRDEAVDPFAKAAIAAARGWQFHPARRGTTSVAARIRFAVAFRAETVPARDEDEEEEADASTREPPVGGAPRDATADGARARSGSGRTGTGGLVEAPDEVRVRGQREPSRTVSLTRAEVRQIPGAFGDPFRAVEIMPGVTPVVSGLPFFFVRGAPPGNVGYFLDGIRIPLLFHVGAGPSVIHPGLVQRVDLYPGGYPARFGRFSGGVVAGETAPPLDRPHGEFNVRLFDAGAMIETPFGQDGRGSLLVGGRYSYTAFLLTQLSSNTLLDYWDYQVRASYALGPDDRIGVFAFGSYDYLAERTPTQTVTLFGTEFHRVDVRYDRRLGSRGTFRLAVTPGVDRSRVQEDRSVRNRVLGARTEWSYRASDSLLVRAGTDLQLDSYDVQAVTGTLSPSVARVASFFPTRTDLAFGVRADAVASLTRRLEVTPGARVDLFTSQGASAIGVDPRVALRAEASDRVRVLSAIGVAHQPPSFVVPVPGFQPGGLRGGLQKAYQQSLGVEADVFEATTATLTVFQNAFADMSDPLGTRDQQLGGCPPGRFPTDTLAGDRGRVSQGQFFGNCGVPRFPEGTIGPDRTGGGGQAADSRGTQQTANAFEVRTRGRAFGLELFVKRKLTSRIGGFLSYTLSRSTRTYEGRTFVATFDRTHVVNAALAFDLGRNWRAGTRVTYYTGLPKPPDPTDPSDRLPSFFRLDLRLEKRWQLSKTWWISGVAEWLNSTLSKEAVATQCTLAGCQSQLVGPITIPSLGVEGGF